MNKTFLIGNGFDCNLHMKSRFKDFLPYYCERHPDSGIAKSMLMQSDLWSDMELQLGEYTECVSPDNVDSFYDEKEELEACLSEYLLLEQKKVKLETNIGNEFKQKLGKIANEFTPEDRCSIM